jgi:predicted branched-subunit amino acid permease
MPDGRIVDNASMTGPLSALTMFDSRLWHHPARREGMRDMARVMPGLMAWALVTGVAMAKSGLPLGIVALMSLSVFAASAQLATVPLMLAGAPLWVIWLTALCVNLRFVIYSAQLRPHMMALPLRWRLVAGYLSADVTYVMSVHRHGGAAPASTLNPEPLAYFVGLALVNFVGWNVASLAGVLFAAWIPTQWGLAFAGTVALLGLMVTLAKDGRTLLSAGLAGTAALAAFGLPFRLNIVVAVAAAVACGLLLEAVDDRRQAQRVKGSA